MLSSTGINIKNAKSSIVDKQKSYRDVLMAPQESPERLVNTIVNFFKKIHHKSPSLIDIGCGSGKQFERIVSQLPNYFGMCEGLDWSPTCIKYHLNKTNSPYQEVRLCSSNRLPFGDKQFDISLSMENLEHLYALEAIKSIKEMSRISKIVVITTPSLKTCFGYSHYIREMQSCLMDKNILSKKDYTSLESLLHKSCLSLESMLAAGFKSFNNGADPFHMFLWAHSSEIQFDKLQGIGIKERNKNEGVVNHPSGTNYRERYLMLLADCLSLFLYIPYIHRRIDFQTDERVMTNITFNEDT